MTASDATGASPHDRTDREPTRRTFLGAAAAVAARPPTAGATEDVDELGDGAIEGHAVGMIDTAGRVKDVTVTAEGMPECASGGCVLLKAEAADGEGVGVVLDRRGAETIVGAVKMARHEAREASPHAED